MSDTLTATDEVMFNRDREIGEPPSAGHSPESGLGFEHPGGGPAEAHLAGGPVLDVAVDHADGGAHRLARIGRLKGELKHAGDY